MPLPTKNLHTVSAFPGYIAEFNVDIPLRTAAKTLPHDPQVVRGNVYRPKGEAIKSPVLVTYGPYGKDIPYSVFHPKSFAEVNPEHKSEHSAWETPDPAFWTAHGYAVLRVDERGCGQSGGMLDSMSSTTSDAFFDVVEWAAEQPWSTGKVGLLGISYYAGSQWRVAARRPKGLAAIVPWEGMSDYYRDRVRHGGILSNTFIEWWWNRQVVSNQYGLAGRAARNWGPDTLEGSLTEEELQASRRSQPEDTAKYKFRDEEYYKTRDFKLSDIEVPLLSVANWGGILLHLRGNIMGYMQAGSKLKYLRCITGRHDLPFYYADEVEIQKSFLDAFLKGDDRKGWSIPGKLPPVDICLREGNPGVNDPPAERAAFPRRQYSAWPIPGTQYTKFFLNKSGELTSGEATDSGKLKYDARIGELNLRTNPFSEKTEITGHPLAHLVVSVLEKEGSVPSDMDVFVTIRHYDEQGKEIFYTGTTGEPVPVVKGWLRLSLRKVDASDPAHREYLPHRNYFSSDVQAVEPAVEYPVDLEIWPTNVVVDKGHSLGLQIAGHDTQGSGLFEHTHPVDRAESTFKGWNQVHVGPGHQSYLVLPIVPQGGS
ncbi:Alpha/Beta hydrolase protein [Dactylonectria macrodidyma]|uniref:Alpha/Beta hydrolase protein n=1 Tax=Dactylonectria macrodidyma TaxID=307937 RepID=A0A9P9E9I2_9HYPO|nr:Alpha/Beta hydrolase protein [Dactylonectria macrodidyma]